MTLRTLSLSIPSCIFLGLLVALSTSLWAQTPSVAESFLFAAANQDRAAHNLPPLRLDPKLTWAAHEHASQMVRRRTISHQFVGEDDLVSRAKQAGVNFSLVTENVAEASDSSEIHELWMRSPGHRANLLDPKVDIVGISVLSAGEEFFAVEDFAREVAVLELDQQEFRVSEEIKSAGLRVSPAAQDARATCAESSGYVGARKPWFVMRYTTTNLGRLPEQLIRRMAEGKYREAAVGACLNGAGTPFSGYSIAVLLYP